MKTIICALCGATVTKRQSLLIEPYGRICRSHPEVEAYHAKMEEERQAVLAAKHSVEQERGIMRKLHIMAAVSCIRSMSYIRGIPLNDVAGLVVWRQPKDEQAEILKELQERGDMTPEEFLGGLMLADKLGVTL